MKKNLFYPAVHITEVMKRLGRSADNTDNYLFSLRDLDLQTDKSYTERTLSGAVDAVAHRRKLGENQVCFEWVATGNYAPDICLAALPAYGPAVDQDGFLSTPIRYDYADLVLPFFNIDFKGNTADSLVTWGFYSRMDRKGNRLHGVDDIDDITDDQTMFWSTGGGTEIVHNFCHCDTSTATHVLLAIPWGGAHSETRGQTKENLTIINDLEMGLEFFQRRSSSKGGKGYDFYIIDIVKAIEAERMDNFRQMLWCSLDRITYRQHSNNYMFLHKYFAFNARQKEYAKFKEEATRIEDLLNERYKKEIRGAEVAGRPCVVLPEKVGSVYDYLELPKQPADYTRSLEEMNQARIPAETWKRLEVTKDVLNAKMDAWLDFAPRYADLADLVILGCHGTAEVHLNCLKMTMPSINPLEYEFSEAHLGACVEYVQEFLSDLQAKRESSLSAISKLIEKVTKVSAE